MELWLLGGGAVVLIAITLWIVWPAEIVESMNDPLYDEEDILMTPQGDEFEDQYTSATADLSAGGVATAIDAMQEEAEAAGRPEPTQYRQPSPYGVPAATREPSANAAPTATGAAGEPSSSPTIAREGATDATLTPAPPAWPELQAMRRLARPRAIGLGAAAVLAIGGAIFGAWLYARWQRRRNEPINRARRGLRYARREVSSSLRDAQKEVSSSLRDAQKDVSSSLRDAQKDLSSSLRDAQKELRSTARQARKELSSSRLAAAVRA
jgi:hypothetical protein